MTNESIRIAQEYLTVDCVKIMDVEDLSKRHALTKILSLLENIMQVKKEEVKDMVLLQVTGKALNKCICEWFRIQLAINILREEVNYEKSNLKQRAEGSRNAA